MKIKTLLFENGKWKNEANEVVTENSIEADVLFLFGETDTIKDKEKFYEIRKLFPDTIIIGSSTSGNIVFSEVSDYKMTATAVKFDSGKVKLSSINFKDDENIELLSEKLVKNLISEDLKHIFIISDGLLINGSELTKGINKIAKNIPVTGGMAGDGARFQETYVIANEIPKQRTVLALGFYGDSLEIGTGCFSGWSEFGTQRTITKSNKNVVYEIDGEPALDLYKRYLGELANDLPNSGLRFPLSIKQEGDKSGVIRTLLAIDENEKSITFAGDVPQGCLARLMKADIDLLIDGAGIAASYIEKTNNKTALGLIVSCVGRKIIMNQLIDDELEAVQDILGDNVNLTGFYSYGEIAPFYDDILNCKLHNQTMTITTIYES